MGIVTGIDLLDALLRLTGVDKASGRLELRLPDRRGGLARLTALIAERQLNIHSILTYPEGAGQVRAVLRVDTLETRPLADGAAGSGVRGRVAGREAMAELIYTPAYGSYDFGAEHPFSPARQQMALDLLAAFGHRATWTEPEPATRDELLTVHDEAYVAVVEAVSAGETVADLEAWGLGTPDTPAVPGIDPAVRALVGGTLTGARLLSSGRATRVLQFGGGLHHARAGSRGGVLRLQRPRGRDPSPDRERPLGLLPGHRRAPRRRRAGDLQP